MASTWTTNKQEIFKKDEVRQLSAVVFIEGNGVEGRYSKQPFSNEVRGFKIEPNGAVAFKDGGEDLYIKFSGNTAVEVGYA